MQLQQYFDRIGFRGSARADRETLHELLRLHVTTVPFENLDVQFKRPLTIGIEAAFEKIVTRRRGGWCYEQNGLFGWVLSEIGFDVTRLAAAVMRHERGEIATANHLTLQVRVPGSPDDLLVDVGFGGSMLAPIPLAEGEHYQTPFRLGLQLLDDGYWRFWEDAGDGQFSFDFLAEPANEAELEHRCQFLQTDPSSGFVQSLVAQLRKPDRHLTLRGRVLTTVMENDIRTETLDSASQVVAVLADEFRLSEPGIEALWPRIVKRHEEVFNSAAT